MRSNNRGRGSEIVLLRMTEEGDLTGPPVYNAKCSCWKSNIIDLVFINFLRSNKIFSINLGDVQWFNQFFISPCLPGSSADGHLLIYHPLAFYFVSCRL